MPRKRWAGQNNAAEPQVDDEGGADAGAPVRQRRQHHGAEAGDPIARNVRADRQGAHAVERLPAARLAQDLSQEPGNGNGPQRQEQQRVSDAAVVQQVRHRPEDADDEIEVGRGAGEEAGRDAARQRAWRKILRRAGSRKQRPREGVGESI